MFFHKAFHTPQPSLFWKTFSEVHILIECKKQIWRCKNQMWRCKDFNLE